MKKTEGLLIIVLSISSLLLGGCTHPNSTNNNLAAGRDSKASAPQVSAREIKSAYEANGVAADDRYKGQMIQITGTVQAIGSTSDGSYVSVCEGDPSIINVRSRAYVPRFLCYFDDNHRGELAKLAKGQTIIVRGIFVGVPGGAVPLEYVQLKKCESLEAKP